MRNGIIYPGVHPRLSEAFETVFVRFNESLDGDTRVAQARSRELIVASLALKQLCKSAASVQEIDEKIGLADLPKRVTNRLVSLCCASIEPAGNYSPEEILLGLEEGAVLAVVSDATKTSCLGA